jgi:probable biosynthetic protein (TIGR04098 family)
VLGTGLPLVYRILPESDLNGAGLLYFARYVAIANYGVRRFLTEQLARPVSSPLVECLATERLSTYYFFNADAFDSVRVFVAAWLDPAPPSAPDLDASGCRVAARFAFHVDLYRASDGVLMGSCRLHKSLNLPDREKGLVYEGERLLARLRGGA